MRYDSVIIGFGKAGKTIAGFLAKKNEKVALIEKSDKMYGGTCINVGCLPSKNLVKSSEFIHELKPDFETASKLYTKAVEEKKALISKLRKKNYDKVNNLDNVTVIDGTASFLNNKTVKVLKKDGSEEILEGDKIFINTGSETVIPDIPGLKDNKYVVTSNELLDLETLPQNLTIIGGGYIGLEFASMYSNFGSKVTILEAGDTFIKREDEDIAAEIKKVLENKGVKIEMEAKTESIEGNKLTFIQKGEKHSIENTYILVAIGRKPATKDLHLENTDIKVGERGHILVDETLKTSVDNVYAMGDVCEAQQFTYISLDDYRILVSNLFGNKAYNQNKRKNVPYSVFISPAFSRVGINEKEAVKLGKKYKVSKLMTAAIPKANVIGKPEGMLKVLIEEDTGKILGAMLFCAESYEMINLIKLAMDANLDYSVLRDNVYTHPTMTESFNDLFNI